MKERHPITSRVLVALDMRAGIVGVEFDAAVIDEAREPVPMVQAAGNRLLDNSLALNELQAFAMSLFVAP